MAVYLAPTFGVGYQAFDAVGQPLNEGKIYTYQAGTSTPAATYTSDSGMVQNANPIILDSDGRPPDDIWLTDGQAYLFELRDSSNNLIRTYDDIPGINNLTTISVGDGSAGAPSIKVGDEENGLYSPGANQLAGAAGGANAWTATSASFMVPGTFTAAGTGTSSIAGPLSVSGAAAGQIVFPGTQNASTNVNTLDDYEEGTWTPAITFATAGDLAVVYSVQVANYTKIGKLVVASLNITTSTFTHTTASGVLQITGLPFAAQGGGVAMFGCGAVQGITLANYGTFSARVGSGAQLATVRASGSAQTEADITAANMPTGGTVRLEFTIMYMASA